MKKLVERVWGWRRGQWGPPTAEYVATVMADTYVNWQQVGASLRWWEDESGRTLHAQAGPLGATVLVGRASAVFVPEEPDTVCLSMVVRGRQVHVYRLRRHLGGLVEWGRIAAGRAVRVELGPIGLVIEPA